MSKTIDIPHGCEPVHLSFEHPIAGTYGTNTFEMDGKTYWATTHHPLEGGCKGLPPVIGTWADARAAIERHIASVLRAGVYCGPVNIDADGRPVEAP